MKLRLTFGIFPKLLLTMLVVTLIPLGAIWYLDYRAESENLSRQTEQRLSSQADTMVGVATRPAQDVELFLRVLVVGLEADALAQEFLELRYAGDDKLFVPVERLDLVQKYTGATRPPGG